MQRKQQSKIILTPEEYERRLESVRNETIATTCRNMIVIGAAILLFGIGKLYRNKQDRVKNWFLACTELMTKSLEPTKEMIQADEELAKCISCWKKLYY